MYFVYMVQCTDGTYYTGITPDVCHRMQAHCAGKGAKYTRSHPIASLCALWRTEEKTAAARLEYAIKKRLCREEKKMLIAQNEEANLQSFYPLQGSNPLLCLQFAKTPSLLFRPHL